MKKTIYLILFIATIFSMWGGTVLYADLHKTCLHHTTEGMRYWYEAKDGFMALTNVPYEELTCKNCHSKSCSECHLEKTENGGKYSLEMAQKTETCFKCHSRASAVAQMDKQLNTVDVHVDAGMVCADCHTSREVHGDGNDYKTMRDPNAKDARCANCHTKDSEDYPAIPDTQSHLVHNDKLDCNACHVRNTMTCYNCHFGELAKTKSKPKSFTGKVKDFLLLVNYNGKVTTGNLQTLVSAENKPFIVYAPYLTHSVMREGRQCEDCHATEAVKTIASGEIHTMAEVKDGEIDFYKGVVPLSPDRLEWPFLHKKDGKWIPIETNQKPLVQMGLFAEPFTQDSLDKLKKKQVYKESLSVTMRQHRKVDDKEGGTSQN